MRRLKKKVASEHVNVMDRRRCSFVMPAKGFARDGCRVMCRPQKPLDICTRK